MAHGHDGDALGDAAPALARAALALARRFAAGGTLWSWAPGAREHAQHVAVEFVHPVIMGTRALPAVALVDDDPAALRPMARAGDALLVIADGDAPIAKVLHRAEAWGLTTIHLGVGAPPLDRTAEHVLWLSDDPRARVDGRLVLGYHVLWELTHVCFEHPGLVNDVAEEAQAVCTVCSDEGRLAEVVLIDRDDAQVRTAQGIETVSTLMVGPVQPGDLVLVHAGTAISVVDP
jgi:hypothetical protein